jgi:hypothetical protein
MRRASPTHGPLSFDLGGHVTPQLNEDLAECAWGCRLIAGDVA